jgi:hypothetical protein
LEKYSGWDSGELGAGSRSAAAARLFWAEEGLELGVGFEDVFRHGAQDIDAEVTVFGVLKGRGDEFEGEASAAELLGDFGVPEGQPAVAVGLA